MNFDFSLLLAEENSEKVLDSIDEIIEKKEQKAVHVLLSLLDSTADHDVRNRAAVALNDFKEQKAVELLIKKINDPKLTNNRGTLVRALQGLDYSEHYELLFDLMLHGNYEVCRNAFDLLKDYFESIRDIHIIKKRMASLVEKIDGLQADLDLYIGALEMLSR